MYSVVIPVYEAAAQVGRCVASWLSQTEKDLELILVDDGSADGSGKICDQYAEKDPRVHVIHQKNAGVSAARNAGMEAAEGEYLLFTDSDDYVAEDYLEKMASCQRESAADLVLCGFHHLYDGADIRKIPKPAGTFRVSEEPEDFLRLYEQGFFNMPWNKLYKRELAGRFDISISLGEDLLFNLDYLRKCRTVCVLAEPLCYYIQEEQKTTLSSRKRQDRLSLAKRICEETERFYEQICREENAERRSMGHRRIFTRYMNEIMDECEKMPTEKSLTRREKMQVIRFCAEDRWVRERGCEAIFFISGLQDSVVFSAPEAGGDGLSAVCAEVCGCPGGAFYEKKEGRNRMEPLISVIVPVYRVEAYLDRCMASLLAQTYENLEIILVDDGSPDGCPGLCDSYAQKDRRVRVIHQDNRGLSGARNTGIEAAGGDYLAFVDSDDYVSRDFIRTLYELLEETGCAISQCRFAYVKGEPLRGTKDRDYHMYRGESLMGQLYGPEEEATCFVVAWNKLYKRELFDRIRYPLGRIHEDEATTYRLFHEGKKLVFTERILYGYYTENAGSITAVFSRKRLQWLTAQEERILFFQENGYERLLPAAYRKLCDACITFYLRCTKETEEQSAVQKDLMESLKRYCIQGDRWIRRLPFRTRIGYRLFCVSPFLYEKLLKGMQGSV